MSQIILNPGLAGTPSGPSDPFSSFVEYHIDFNNGLNEISGKNRTTTITGGTIVVNPGFASMQGGYFVVSNGDSGLTIAASEDFCLELWGNASNVTNRGYMGTSTGGNMQILVNESTGSFTSYWNNYLWSNVGSITANTDFHLSVSRQSGISRFHKDGTLVSSNANFSSTSFIADEFCNSDFRSPMPGTVKRIRVTIGASRYGSGNFVPDYPIS